MTDVDVPSDVPSEDPADAAAEDPAKEGAVVPAVSKDPSWWQRSHPTFAGVVGFFAGVAFIILVPGIYAWILSSTVSEKTAERLFPYVLIALVVPLAMLVIRKTRRFAQYMFLGIVSTVLVVAATTALVLWIMVSLDK